MTCRTTWSAMTNKFSSKALDTDDKFSFTFDKAGSYPYYCSIHPRMTAKVIVQAKINSRKIDLPPAAARLLHRETTHGRRFPFSLKFNIL